METQAQIQTQNFSTSGSVSGLDPLFYAAFENAAVGMTLVSLDKKWITVNRKYATMMGYSRDEIMKLSFPEVSHPEENPIDRENVQKLLDGELQEYIREKRFIHKSGSIVWGTVNVSLVRDAAGAPQFLVAVIQDNAFRREADEKLKESRDQLDAILRGVTEGITVLNSEGQFVYANTAGARMCGSKSVEEFLKTSTREIMERFELMDEQGNPFPVDQLPGRLALQGVLSPPEVMLQCRDRTTGRETWSIVSASPILNSEGKVKFAVSIFRDFTEHKEAQELLRQSERHFRTLSEAMPQIVFTADSDGWTDYYNSRWYEYTGLSIQDSDGWTWKEVLHPDDHGPALERWKAAVETGDSYETEYRFKRASDGMYRWHLGRGFPLRDSSGKIIKWLGTCTDIHDHKVMQQELKEAIRVRDEFLSIASHELRTPLTPLKLRIQSLALFLKEVPNLDPVLTRKMEQTMQVSERQVKRLSGLVDDLLDSSRITSGKLTLEKSEVDLSELLTEILERDRAQFHSAGCALDHDIEAPLVAVCDRVRVEQVIVNLLTNAVKYAPRKPVHVRIYREGEMACLSVQDQGVGIPPEDQSRIFERFERVESDYNIGGLGLGLYIARQILQAHQGSIAVQSEVGKGSTFFVRIPLA